MTNKSVKSTLRLSLISLSVFILIGIIGYCILTLSGLLPNGFSAEVFFSPLRMMKQFLMASSIMGVIIVFLIIKGLMGQKLWYLLPIGITTLGLFWLMSNILVINLIKKALQ